MAAAATTASLRQQAGYLPAEVDSFVGRRREMAEVRRLFTMSPLVTLAGPGGVGKTRLVGRTASGLVRSFRDGLCFVALSSVHDSALLTPTVAEALGLREQSNAITAASIVEHLSARRLLLVLDNCEQVLGPVAELVDTLLRNCPELRVLATSREPLGIAGESVLRVPPLTVPDLAQGVSTQALPRYEAINLFTDRAVTARADFALTDSNSRDVAQICQQLDGVPLAIELAAARLRTLSTHELATRLADKFGLLTGGSRVAPPRHQTLRLCIDWSHEQCTDQEQVLWSRLSVFAGSFELDAAESICGFSGIDRSEVLDLLTSLVDKSVVTRGGDADTVHFRMLETLRQYGRESSIRLGEDDELQRRHRDWYRDMVVTANDELISERQMYWLARLDRELPNIRAVLEFSVNDADGLHDAQLVAGALHMLWISRGLLTEGRYWLGRALVPDGTEPSRAMLEALYSGVALAGFQGDVEAADIGVAMSRKAGAALGDRGAEAYVADVVGMVALFRGDLGTAVLELGRAAAGHRECGDLNREVEISIGLGLAAGLAGDSALAESCHERVLEITRPRGESWYQAYSLWALGIARWHEGDLTGSQDMLEQSLRLRRSMNDLLGSVWCLEGLAFVAAAHSEAERSAVLLGASAALSAQAGTPTATFVDLAAAYAAAEQASRQALGATAFDKAYARGGGLEVADAVAYALGEVIPDRAPAADSSWSVLTPRERQVADLVARGLTNADIADKLVISSRTAEGHVENILSKLSFTSRTQIAAWVTDLG